VGREIAVSAAGSFKKVSLEMGGKNPTVVFADCDFDSAVKGAVRSAFLNQGQICLCGSRLLIEISIYDKFKRAFLKEVSKLKVGDPRQKDVDQGAIVSGAHFEKIMGAIEKAKNEGGQILTGGKNVVVPGEFSRGWYIAPTVIEGLGADCQTNQEEIFGPVVTIQSFNSDDEALKLANSTRYGLAASLWTTDAERIKWFSQALEVGVVWVNTWMARDLRTPFGGVKESGVGREGGKFALQFFSEIKNVCIKDHQGEQA
jgi:aminomuconate-semialdehyde/2-hydroxymuconate-6-semialdehyde dehydrogenase